GQGHDCPLGVGALTEGRLAPVTLPLAFAVERVDLEDLHVEQLLDGLADLDLVGGGRHQERVHAEIEQGVRLLGNDRPKDHLTRIVHLMSSSAFAAAALGWTGAALGWAGTSSPAEPGGRRCRVEDT